MVRFDDDAQNKHIQNLREREEEELVSMLAQTKYQVPYVDLSGESVDNDALRLFSLADVQKLDVGPFKLIGKKVWVAVRSPLSDGAVKAKNLLEKKGYDVVLVMASEKSIHKVWSRYEDLSYATTSKSGGLDISPDVINELSEKVHSLQEAIAQIVGIQHEDSQHRLSRILEVILGCGIALDASDIHIEPGERGVLLRFRLDGVLRVVTELDFETYRKLNTRIKLLSGLKLTITENPQDGRFSSFLETKDTTDEERQVEINYRTSLIPGAYGETVVLRILNPQSIHVDLDDLGISEPLHNIFMEEIKKPNGLILLTGPTGSGKTTTLYAFMQKIYTPDINIITIEDPIEYHLPGLTQTQVEHKKGYTFLEGLRSALRQDPDVIMVGEIRDAETAKTAVESSLTGHLVFSTLHTNNASGVIPRLIDLDVNPKIMVSALTLSIAQRLVRKLCEHCKQERPVTADERAIIDRLWDGAVANGKDIARFGVSKEQTTIFESKGCDKCNGTGYKGRIGIFEAIRTDEAIEKIIIQSPSERDIKKLADTQGTLDMREDGLVKILKGITDFAEVQSVVDLTEE
jgi:type II secretory ATPase GspE/PulE/Tfp pilus assembly ATPase PilB-like protein